MRRINKPIWLLCAFAIVVTAFAARGDAQLPQTRGVQAAGEIGVDPIEEPGGAKSTLPFGVQFAAGWGLDLLDGVADGVFVWRPSTELVIGADRVLGGGDA
mgnify:CR=1 FL=1